MEGPSRKKIRDNVKRDSDADKRTDITEGHTKSLTYDVLRIIFSYLNGKDLASASIVCRSWLEAANNEKRTRGPVCLTKEYEIYLMTQEWTLERVKTAVIRKLPIKPALGLCFTPRVISFDRQDCHCKALPSSCDSVSLGTYGIVINNKEVEENERSVVYGFLPEIPNLTRRTFVLEDDSLIGVPKSRENFVDGLSKFYESNNSEDSRCLLIFCTQYGRKQAIRILNRLKCRYPGPALPVWGGVASDLLACNSRKGKRRICSKSALCVAVALAGNMQTWSIIVDKSCNTTAQVEQRLKSLRSGVRLRKHSMGFMFACCARGEKMFGEEGVESLAFKNLFPDVPLVGCFGDGEFGENTIPNENSKKKAKWYNETSTVFMVLTYG
ncbi:hypothetical protein KM043_003128 [Ampulex compressa]|nr:hypothetical protein KM043_003128 [Ampulex compressa]